MSEAKSSRSFSQWVLITLIIFAAAAAGMYFGGALRQQQGAENAGVEADVFGRLALVVGTVFPNVELETPGYGRTGSQDILHPNGTIILFMETDCSPCHSLSIEWQKAIGDGLVKREQVVGISFSDVNNLAEALAHYQISFPLYADPNYAFMDQYGVDAFPLILVVGKSGTIRYCDYDARKKIAPADLREMLEG